MAIDFTWFISIGILIGLSLVLSFLSEDKINMMSILAYMTIICAFMVSTGLLPLWIVVLLMLACVALAVINMRGGINIGK